MDCEWNARASTAHASSLPCTARQLALPLSPGPHASHARASAFDAVRCCSSRSSPRSLFYSRSFLLASSSIRYILLLMIIVFRHKLTAKSDRDRPQFKRIHSLQRSRKVRSRASEIEQLQPAADALQSCKRMKNTCMVDVDASDNTNKAKQLWRVAERASRGRSRVATGELYGSSSSPSPSPHSSLPPCPTENVGPCFAGANSGLKPSA